MANSAEADLLMASAPVAAQDYKVQLPPALPRSRACRSTIWGTRHQHDVHGHQDHRRLPPDALRWHPEGLAIDVMIPNYHSPEGIELGNQIAGFALANAKRWGVACDLAAGLYPGIGAPSWTADYGNETANHFDHAHIATDGGGYPHRT